MSTLTYRVLGNVYKDTASEMWELLNNKYEVKDAQGIILQGENFFTVNKKAMKRLKVVLREFSG